MMPCSSAGAKGSTATTPEISMTYLRGTKLTLFTVTVADVASPVEVVVSPETACATSVVNNLTLTVNLKIFTQDGFAEVLTDHLTVTVRVVPVPVISDCRKAEGVTGKLQPPCMHTGRNVGMPDPKPSGLVTSLEPALSDDAPRPGLGEASESVITRLIAIRDMRVIVILLPSVDE